MVGDNVEIGGSVDAEAIEATAPNPALAAATVLDATSSYRPRATGDRCHVSMNGPGTSANVVSRSVHAHMPNITNCFVIDFRRDPSSQSA